jgi:hypothetical protein
MVLHVLLYYFQLYVLPVLVLLILLVLPINCLTLDCFTSHYITGINCIPECITSDCITGITVNYFRLYYFRLLGRSVHSEPVQTREALVPVVGQHSEGHCAQGGLVHLRFKHGEGLHGVRRVDAVGPLG